MKTRVNRIMILCVILLFLLYFAYVLTDQISSKIRPPDISHCTHLEVIYSLPLIKYFHPPVGFDPNFLTDNETEYLQSIEKFRIDDEKSIEHIAHAVTSCFYN
jgi:hypothetical protein